MKAHLRVIFGLLALAAGLWGLAAGLRTAPRSLVLVTVSGLGAGEFDPSVTPVLAEMAQEGTRFDLYTPIPSAVPALASLFTARPPWELGIRFDDVARLPAAPPTLAERLAARGYHARGWVGQGEVEPLSGLWRGFERCMFPSFPFTAATTPEETDRVRRGSGGWIPAETVGDLAVRYVRAVQPGTAVFLWLHLAEPALAARAADPPTAYREALRAVDAAVAKVRAAVATSGLGGSFVLAVAGLHGMALGEAGESGAGLTLSERVFRVPVVVEGVRLEGSFGKAPRGLAALGPLLLRSLGIGAEMPGGPVVSASWAPGRFYGWPDVGQAGDERGWFRRFPEPVWEPAGGEAVRGDAALAAAPPDLVGAVDRLGLTGGSAPPAEVRAEVLGLMSEAHARLASGEPAAALSSLGRAAQLAPEALAPRLAALEAAKAAEDDAALRDIVEWLSSAPDVSWVDRARALLAAGETRAAAKIALEVDPESAGLGELAVRARVLERAGAADAAVASLEAMMERDGSWPDLLEWQGDILLATGNAYRARQAYEAALAGPSAMMDFERANLLAKLGDALDQLGRPEEALATYARAVALDPHYRYPHARAADLLAKMGRIGAAADAAAKSVRPREDPVQQALAEAQAMRSHRLVGPAIARLREAVAARPGSAPLRVALAPLLAEAGKVDEAREVLEPLLRPERNRADAWIALARVAAIAGDEEAALAALDRAEALAGPRLSELVRRDGTFRRFGPDSELARRARRFEGRREASRGTGKEGS